MKVLINTSSTLKGGGLQVAKSFVEELKDLTENTYIVILGQNLSKLINQQTFPANFTFYIVPYRPGSRLILLSKTKRYFNSIEQKHKPDVVFTTSGPAYWRPKAPHLVGYNLGHYIYPESPYFKVISIKYKLRWFIKKQVAGYFFKRDSDAFVVQTDDVNQRLKKWLQVTKVYTVSNTCHAAYFNEKPLAPKLPLKQPNEYRLLTIAAYHPHKNFRILPAVINVLETNTKQKIKFVLTLPQNFFEKLFTDEQRKFVHNLGPVTVEECPSLYKECDAMFLPTLVECFSASYVEAMVMQKPIITSDMGFAQTVCKDAALYFNPSDPKDIAAKIEMLVNSTNLQNNLIDKGNTRKEAFGTSNKRAKTYLQICQTLIDEKN
jgi:glycosyltransferase involved in cell wall biosynthesis